MKWGMEMLNLFVLEYASNAKIPTVVKTATEQDLIATRDWQTVWTTPYAKQLPNKVALHRTDNDELLGLMSYELDEDGLAVEILYLETPAIATLIFSIQRADRKSTSELQRRCLLTPYKFRWMQDLTEF